MTSGDNALLPLLDAFEMMTSDTDGFYPPIDTAETVAALEGTGMDSGADAGAFEKYVPSSSRRDTSRRPGDPPHAKARRPEAGGGFFHGCGCGHTAVACGCRDGG
ncbi:hypothetical protein ACQ9NK_31185 [Streptomyces lividans]